jgi:UDP-glucuronate 4-epimerase
MILVTGCAGFIGFHLTQRLLREGRTVIGVDNLNAYYDPKLKHDRLAQLLPLPGFTFRPVDLCDQSATDGVFSDFKPAQVVNLAAQAGVRYSLQNPRAYVDSNVSGFLNILEGCRHHAVGHLVYASSSSVYGLNTTMPYSTQHNVDHPVSLYAATKKANELMAHSYSHLYRIPTTGLRFFTVYGPWGRPDMAYHLFTKAITEGKPIDVFNNGQMKRDFTYIDDVVEGIVRVLARPAAPNPDWRSDTPDRASSPAPYRLYNIGNHAPVELSHFIATIEGCLGRKAVKRLLPLQPGDVLSSFADVDDLMKDVGFAPHTPIEKGLAAFVAWYADYYRR